MSCFGSENGNLKKKLTNEKRVNGASRKQTKTAPVKPTMTGWGFGVD
jgi:hypothetical protein